MAGWFVDRTGWTGTLETQTAAGVRTSENTKTACAECWKGKSELIKLSGSPFHCLLPSFGVTYSRCQTKQGKPGVSWEQIWEDRDKRGRHHQSMKWMKICNVTKIDEDICIFFRICAISWLKCQTSWGETCPESWIVFTSESVWAASVRLLPYKHKSTNNSFWRGREGKRREDRLILY